MRRIRRNGCAVGTRSSRSTYENSSPLRSSDPRILASDWQEHRNHIRTPASAVFFSRLLEDTLNMSGPGQGDAHDQLNTQMREVARFHVTQTMQHIEQTL